MRSTIPRRYVMVALCFLATFICYIDRVNISVAIIPMAEEYGWSNTTKGLVLSSFFIGYLGAMIPAGWLANRIGGRLLLGLALIGWSVFTLLTPLAAGISLGALIITRILMGAGESASFPAVYNLFARWVPHTERARAIAFNTTGVSLGTVVALSTSGALVSALGWSSVFYVFGLAGILFALLWFRQVYARPELDPRMGSAERELLAPLQPQTGHAQQPIPWRRLLAHRAVWALLINHFCANWGIYLMLAWLPSYFRDVQGLSITGSGLFAVGPWLSQFLVGNLGAVLADRLVARGADLTRLRKTLQASGLLGAAAFLLLASQATTPGMALLTLCGAMGCGGLCWSGFMPNFLEVAPRHADVLFAISNSVGTLPGIIGVFATGWLLDATGSYTATFVVAAGICAIGALAWLAWASVEPIIE